MKFLEGIVLPALLAFAPLAAAKKDSPGIEKTAFDSELANIFYFDDSDVAILAEIETGKVWRSEDAGKGWKQLDDLRTIGIIKNPFDSQVAVALGDKKHWITFDRGNEWRQFETDRMPSIAGPPLSFHATDSKKLLFHEVENCFDVPCLGRVIKPRHAKFPANRLLTRIS